MNGFDAAIFDVDGVLVDVSQSYRAAIKESVKIYTNGSVVVSDGDIREMKRLEGFNNDWDVSYALAFGKRTALSRAEKASAEYSELKDVFQELYLGSDLFGKLYSKQGKQTCRGLINEERLLIARGTLESLQDAGLKFGVVTSRPRFEALYALKPLIPDFFFENCIVAQEDCEEEKPSPKPIQLAISRVECKSPVYIGDSYNDVIAAKRALIPCVYVGGEEFGDFQVKDVNELPNLLKISERRTRI